LVEIGLSAVVGAAPSPFVSLLEKSWDAEACDKRTCAPVSRRGARGSHNFHPGTPRAMPCGRAVVSLGWQWSIVGSNVILQDPLAQGGFCYGRSDREQKQEREQEQAGLLWPARCARGPNNSGRPLVDLADCSLCSRRTGSDKRERVARWIAATPEIEWRRSWCGFWDLSPDERNRIASYASI
jgi:hypothetical protein